VDQHCIKAEENPELIKHFQKRAQSHINTNIYTCVISDIFILKHRFMGKKTDRLQINSSSHTMENKNKRQILLIHSTVIIQIQWNCTWRLSTLQCKWTFPPRLRISSSWICRTVVLHANRTVNNIKKIAASGNSDFMTQTTRPHAPAAPRFDNPHDTATKKLRAIRRNELLCAGPQSLSRHEPFVVKLKCFPTICTARRSWVG
jgi:hypothetical protein